MLSCVRKLTSRQRSKSLWTSHLWFLTVGLVRNTHSRKDHSANWRRISIYVSLGQIDMFPISLSRCRFRRLITRPILPDLSCKWLKIQYRGCQTSLLPDSPIPIHSSTRLQTLFPSVTGAQPCWSMNLSRGQTNLQYHGHQSDLPTLPSPPIQPSISNHTPTLSVTDA